MQYRVWCDEHLIFDTAMDSYKILNPKLELELNKTGSFDFTIYPNNPNFDKLRKMKSIITVYQEDYMIFRGRILNDEQGFYNEKQVSCEGELAFLVDSIQRPYEFGGSPLMLFTQLINNHNAQVSNDKKFLVGNVTVADKNDYIARSDTQYLNTLDSIMKKLVEPLGGYLFVRHEADGNYLDWLEDFDVLSNQKIEFGKNLLDINKVTKGEDIATAIIPLGAKLENSEEHLTIKSVNDGVDYVFDEEAVEIYGWIFKTVTWDDVTLPENLLRKANEYLGSARNLIASIELSAVDVPAIGQNPFRIGTYVKVTSEPHSLDANFLVSKLSIQLSSPANNKLTLGTTYSTFTEQSSGNFKTQGEVINNMTGSVQQTVNNAVIEFEEKANSMIEQSAEQIISEVRKDVYLRSETDALVSSVSTQIEQTNEDFTFKFNSLSADFDEMSSDSNARFSELNKYIRFVDGDIVLGELGNELTLRIQNDRISFLQSDIEVAYFSNKKLYVNDGEYLNSLKVGQFAFVTGANGNLSFRKVG